MRLYRSRPGRRVLVRPAGERQTYLDVSLKRFETVFPAAGSSNSAIEMTCEELERYSSNFSGWVDVCKPKEG